MSGPAITEDTLLKTVLDLSKMLGYKSAHFRAAQTSHGWRTPLSGSGVGFPDLVLLRRDRMIVAELKSAKGKLAPEQEEWLDAFRQVPGVETFVWRPDDLEQIAKVLR